MKKHTISRKNSSQAGFTIVELMIATLIFSVILVVITAGVLHFTTDYYKGINSSSTQNAAAAVMNNVSQTIQFSNISGANQPGQGTISSVSYACVGNEEFIYSLGTLDTGANGLYVFNDSGTCIKDNSYLTATNWDSRQDLLQPHMRLVAFSIDQNDATSNTWNVAVTVAYGDADLLCDSTATPGTGGCAHTDGPFDEAGLTNDITTAANPDIHCKSQKGSQFCDVANLSTTVQARVQ